MQVVSRLSSQRKRVVPEVSAAKPPREMLRDLIERSGLSQRQVAKMTGKFSHVSGLNRYMLKDKWGDRPIPVEIITLLIPILRGRGHPAITTDELTALAQLPSGGVGQAGMSVGMPIRFRVDEGTFFKLNDVRSQGAANILPIPDFSAGSQFAVIVGRETLHCVDRSEFATGEVVGRRVVLAVPYQGSDLSEIKVQRVQNERFQGKLIGVVVGSYTRE